MSLDPEAARQIFGMIGEDGLRALLAHAQQEKPDIVLPAREPTVAAPSPIFGAIARQSRIAAGSLSDWRMGIAWMMDPR